MEDRLASRLEEEVFNLVRSLPATHEIRRPTGPVEAASFKALLEDEGMPAFHPVLFTKVVQRLPPENNSRKVDIRGWLKKRGVVLSTPSTSSSAVPGGGAAGVRKRDVEQGAGEGGRVATFAGVRTAKSSSAQRSGASAGGAITSALKAARGTKSPENASAQPRFDRSSAAAGGRLQRQLQANGKGIVAGEAPSPPVQPCSSTATPASATAASSAGRLTGALSRGSSSSRGNRPSTPVKIQPNPTPITSATLRAVAKRRPLSSKLASGNRAAYPLVPPVVTRIGDEAVLGNDESAANYPGALIEQDEASQLIAGQTRTHSLGLDTAAANSLGVPEEASLPEIMTMEEKLSPNPKELAAEITGTTGAPQSASVAFQAEQQRRPFAPAATPRFMEPPLSVASSPEAVQASEGNQSCITFSGEGEDIGASVEPPGLPPTATAGGVAATTNGASARTKSQRMMPSPSTPSTPPSSATKQPGRGGLLASGSPERQVSGGASSSTSRAASSSANAGGQRVARQRSEERRREQAEEALFYAIADACETKKQIDVGAAFLERDVDYQGSLTVSQTLALLVDLGLGADRCAMATLREATRDVKEISYVAWVQKYGKKRLMDKQAGLHIFGPLPDTELSDAIPAAAVSSPLLDVVEEENIKSPSPPSNNNTKRDLHEEFKQTSPASPPQQGLNNGSKRRKNASPPKQKQMSSLLTNGSSRDLDLLSAPSSAFEVASASSSAGIGPPPPSSEDDARELTTRKISGSHDDAGLMLDGFAELLQASGNAGDGIHPMFAGSPKAAIASENLDAAANAEAPLSSAALAKRPASTKTSPSRPAATVASSSSAAGPLVGAASALLGVDGDQLDNEFSGETGGSAFVPLEEAQDLQEALLRSVADQQRSTPFPFLEASSSSSSFCPPANALSTQNATSFGSTAASGTQSLASTGNQSAAPNSIAAAQTSMGASLSGERNLTDAGAAGGLPASAVSPSMASPSDLSESTRLGNGTALRNAGQGSEDTPQQPEAKQSRVDPSRSLLSSAAVLVLNPGGTSSMSLLEDVDRSLQGREQGPARSGGPLPRAEEEPTSTAVTNLVPASPGSDDFGNDVEIGAGSGGPADVMLPAGTGTEPEELVAPTRPIAESSGGQQQRPRAENSAAPVIVSIDGQTGQPVQAETGEQPEHDLGDSDTVAPEAELGTTVMTTAEQDAAVILSEAADVTAGGASVPPESAASTSSATARVETNGAPGASSSDPLSTTTPALSNSMGRSAAAGSGAAQDIDEEHEAHATAPREPSAGRSPDVSPQNEEIVESGEVGSSMAHDPRNGSRTVGLHTSGTGTPNSAAHYLVNAGRQMSSGSGGPNFMQLLTEVDENETDRAAAANTGDAPEEVPAPEREVVDVSTTGGAGGTVIAAMTADGTGESNRVAPGNSGEQNGAPPTPADGRAQEAPASSGATEHSSEQQDVNVAFRISSDENVRAGGTAPSGTNRRSEPELTTMASNPGDTRSQDVAATVLSLSPEVEATEARIAQLREAEHAHASTSSSTAAAEARTAALNADSPAMLSSVRCTASTSQEILERDVAAALNAPSASNHDAGKRAPEAEGERAPEKEFMLGMGMRLIVTPPPEPETGDESAPSQQLSEAVVVPSNATSSKNTEVHGSQGGKVNLSGNEQSSQRTQVRSEASGPATSAKGQAAEGTSVQQPMPSSAEDDTTGAFYAVPAALDEQAERDAAYAKLFETGVTSSMSNAPSAAVVASVASSSKNSLPPVNPSEGKTKTVFATAKSSTGENAQASAPSVVAASSASQQSVVKVTKKPEETPSAATGTPGGVKKADSGEETPKLLRDSKENPFAAAVSTGKSDAVTSPLVIVTSSATASNPIVTSTAAKIACPASSPAPTYTTAQTARAPPPTAVKAFVGGGRSDSNDQIALTLVAISEKLDMLTSAGAASQVREQIEALTLPRSAEVAQRGLTPKLSTAEEQKIKQGNTNTSTEPPTNSHFPGSGSRTGSGDARTNITDQVPKLSTLQTASPLQKLPLSSPSASETRTPVFVSAARTVLGSRAETGSTLFTETLTVREDKQPAYALKKRTNSQVNNDIRRGPNIQLEDDGSSGSGNYNTAFSESDAVIAGDEHPLQSQLSLTWDQTHIANPNVLNPSRFGREDHFTHRAMSVGVHAVDFQSPVRWVSAVRLNQLKALQEERDRSWPLLPENEKTLGQQLSHLGLYAVSGTNACFVAALSAFADMPELVWRVFANSFRNGQLMRGSTISGLPPNAQDAAAAGGGENFFFLRLYLPTADFLPGEVAINDRVPCCAKTQTDAGDWQHWRPCFGRYSGALWPYLLEKALGKLFGTYGMLNGVSACLIWSILSGVSGYQVFFPWARKQSNLVDTWGEGHLGSDSHFAECTFWDVSENAVTSDSVWESLKNLTNEGHIVACNFIPVAEDSNASAFGLLAHQLYSIIDCKDIVSGQERHRLLKIRNPFYMFEPFTGSLSREDEWTKLGREVTRHCKVGVSFQGEEEIGAFLEQVNDPTIFWFTWAEFQTLVYTVVYSEFPLALDEARRGAKFRTTAMLEKTSFAAVGPSAPSTNKSVRFSARPSSSCGYDSVTQLGETLKFGNSSQFRNVANHAGTGHLSPPAGLRMSGIGGAGTTTPSFLQQQRERLHAIGASGGAGGSVNNQRSSADSVSPTTSPSGKLYREALRFSSGSNHGGVSTLGGGAVVAGATPVSYPSFAPNPNRSPARLPGLYTTPNLKQNVFNMNSGQQLPISVGVLPQPPPPAHESAAASVSYSQQVQNLLFGGSAGVNASTDVASKISPPSLTELADAGASTPAFASKSPAAEVKPPTQYPVLRSPSDAGYTEADDGSPSAPPADDHEVGMLPLLGSSSSTRDRLGADRPSYTSAAVQQRVFPSATASAAAARTVAFAKDAYRSSVQRARNFPGDYSTEVQNEIKTGEEANAPSSWDEKVKSVVPSFLTANIDLRAATTASFSRPQVRIAATSELSPTHITAVPSFARAAPDGRLSPPKSMRVQAMPLWMQCALSTTRKSLVRAAARRSGSPNLRSSSSAIGQGTPSSYELDSVMKLALYHDLCRSNRQGVGIDQLRFQSLVSKHNPSLSDPDLDELWRACDRDGDDMLNYTEFAAVF
ncbi:unnamed protein product [Amoebophrya sp. A25]|nr:unnamed protein product [Amoebophrya sp. A25]|eukprot:GSA25T00015778001.1